MILIFIHPAYCHDGLFPFSPVRLSEKSLVDRVFKDHCLFLHLLWKEGKALSGLQDHAIC